MIDIKYCCQVKFSYWHIVSPIYLFFEISQQPRCKQRGIKLVALQAAGYVTLAAFTKWMLAHPLGSLPAGINLKSGRGLRRPG